MIKQMIFEPVEDKPGYVWFSKRNFQIISIETLRKLLEDGRVRPLAESEGNENGICSM